MTNLEKFIEARGKFREVMGDFMFRHEDPGDTWDIVVDYLEIPVREWGTYPKRPHNRRKVDKRANRGIHRDIPKGIRNTPADCRFSTLLRRRLRLRVPYMVK